MVSAEHRFNGSLAVFMHWSKSYKHLSSGYQELLSVGLTLLKPFGFDQDFLGFA